MSLIKTLSHTLIAAMFISGGWSTFTNPGGRAERVANAGIPGARQATILNGALMVIGGTALAAGIFPKLATLILIGTLVPTTYVGHPFWKEEQAANRANQQIHFTKNVAMLGGLFAVLAEKN